MTLVVGLIKLLSPSSCSSWVRPLPERLGAVLMASGFGRRFGSNKLLAEVDGVPLYHRAMAALAPAEFDRAVVCSPYPQILAAGERFGFLPLYNGGAAEGISAPFAWAWPGCRTWRGCSLPSATSPG